MKNSEANNSEIRAEGEIKSQKDENAYFNNMTEPNNNYYTGNNNYQNPNTTIKSNLKFTSELLNKPFSTTTKYFENEKKFSVVDNMTSNNFDINNNNNNKLIESATSFFKNENNQNNISMISFSGSMNFNKSNDFNPLLLESKSKRKPFDKLSFNVSATDQNNLFSLCNNMIGNNLNGEKIFDKEKDFNFLNDVEIVKRTDNNINDNCENKKINVDKNINRDYIRDIKEKNSLLKKTNTLEQDNDNAKNKKSMINKGDSLINYSTKNKDNGNNINININAGKCSLAGSKKNINEKNNYDLVLKNNCISNYDGNDNYNINISNNPSASFRSNKSKSSSKTYLNSFVNQSDVKNNLKNYNENENNSNTNNINNKRKFDKSNISNKKLLKSQSQSEVKCFEETNISGLDNLKNNNLQIDLTSNNNNINNNIIAINSNFDNSSSDINWNKNNNNISNANISEINESNVNNTSEINRTVLSKSEISFLKSQTKFLTIETLEKAKLFNTQFGDSVPFWIKFFININENSEALESSSSYFKEENKSKYIKNLIEMVKQDAELYDRLKKHQQIKSDGKAKIKNFLLTEVRLNKENNNNNNTESEINSSQQNRSIEEEESKLSSISNISKIKDRKKTKNGKNQFNKTEIGDKTLAKANDANLTTDDIEKLKEDPINEKLANVLNQYEKLEKHEQRNKVENFSEFKIRLAKKSGKAADLCEKGKNSQTKFTRSVVQQAMNRFNYPNIDNINYGDTEKMKTIDNLKFNDENFDPFQEVDYNDIELGYLDTQELQRLFEIDKRLNMLDSTKYNTSINSVLRDMQKEFNQDKDSRLKGIEAEYKRKMAKIKNKEIKKPSVFDVKVDDNTKPEYQDYLKEVKEKREIKNEMFEIDNKIRLIKNQEIMPEKKNEIFENLQKYYKEHPDYYDKELTKRIPEDFNFDLAEKSMQEINTNLNRLKEDLEAFDNKNNINKDQNPNTSCYEKLEYEQKNKIKQEMLENYENALSQLKSYEKENKEDMYKLDVIYNKLLQDEENKKKLGK